MCKPVRMTSQGGYGSLRQTTCSTVAGCYNIAITQNFSKFLCCQQLTLFQNRGIIIIEKTEEKENVSR